MMGIRKLWFPTLMGILITLLLLFVGMMLGKGEGDGADVFVIALFPYAMLLAAFLGKLFPSIPYAIIVAIFFLQFPAYGILLRNALEQGKFYGRLLFLLVIHLMAFGLCFIVARSL